MPKSPVGKGSHHAIGGQVFRKSTDLGFAGRGFREPFAAIRRMTTIRFQREGNMQARFTRMFAAFVASAIAVLLGATAQAQQQPKSGKYTGKFGNVLTQQTYELEKGHVYNVQTGHGVFFNDVTGGFIDKADVVCAGVTDVVDGVVRIGSGYCTVTDKDGDKAFLIYQLKGTGIGTSEGTFQWTGGTGKYTGLQGNNIFRPTRIGNTPAASIPWEGEWRLP